MAVFVLKNCVSIRTFEKNKQIMSKDKKGVHTGFIEKDADGNYFCGEYLLDYQYTEKSFKVGDEINIKSVIVNPSDKSYNQYPKKSRNFFLANEKE
ncbi:hypothetical protein FBBAL38_04140 [Flavobacteria bacterium BAL38]|jgi:hypothetical protein|nr:hypothetical protein FBBAL38_04140 [Flavobacteria bacterium BAL38]